MNFVNALFAPGLKEAYEPLDPSREQLSPTPSIEFLFALPGADEEEPDSRGAPPAAGGGMDVPADSRAARRSDAADSGERPGDRPERLRRVQAGDIAVLFRALSDVALYEDVFRRRGIDYYLVGGRAFFAQQEVYDLVNLCAFLNDPDDAIALVGILRSPFFSFSDDTLVALAGFGRPLRESLAAAPPADLPEPQQEQVRHSCARSGRALAEKRSAPAWPHLLELAVERTGYDASLLHEFLGRRKVANLRKLIDMAREFDRSGRDVGTGNAVRFRPASPRFDQRGNGRGTGRHASGDQQRRAADDDSPGQGARVPRGDRRRHGSPEPGTGRGKRSTTANSVRCFLRRPREPKSRGTSPSR